MRRWNNASFLWRSWETGCALKEHLKKKTSGYTAFHQETNGDSLAILPSTNSRSDLIAMVSYRNIGPADGWSFILCHGALLRESTEKASKILRCVCSAQVDCGEKKNGCVDVWKQRPHVTVGDPFASRAVSKSFHQMSHYLWWLCSQTVRHAQMLGHWAAERSVSHRSLQVTHRVPTQLGQLPPWNAGNLSVELSIEQRLGPAFTMIHLDDVL